MSKISSGEHGELTVTIAPIVLAIHGHDRLFTRFTLTTTTHQHVRVKSTELQLTKEDSGVTIKKGSLNGHEAVVSVSLPTEKIFALIVVKTVTPAQPGKFLFQLDSRVGQGTCTLRRMDRCAHTFVAVRDPLHLRITYRVFREGAF